MSNGWKIPQSVEERRELAQSFGQTLLEMEGENPLLIFKEHMQNGLLHKAAFQDALNHLQTYANLYMSKKELEELLQNPKS